MNGPERRYATQQERIREIILKELFSGATIAFDARFKPVGITFTIADAKGHRIGHFAGVTTIKQFEEMTDEILVEKIRQGMRFDSNERTKHDQEKRSST
jgi:hypothetical protein